MKFWGIVAAIVLIFAFSVSAYAETQSVKVSGDLTIRGVHRREFDLNENARPVSDNFIMTTTELQVDANLTDNVSTVIRIVNQRNWGDSDYKTLRGQFHNVASTASVTTNQLTVGHGLLDLGIDLAYIQIKELYFEPLTLRIGRQDLWFGRGLIIGANQTDPGFVSGVLTDSNLVTILNDGVHGIGSPELTAFNSFDAIRATIDFEKYAPFVVDLIYFKNDEGKIGPEDDLDVYGVNAGYTWNVYNAEAEVYYWLRHNKDTNNPFEAGADKVNTVGIRGSFMPIEEFVFGAEAAYQFGQYIASPGQQAERGRSAALLNLFVEYLGWTKYLYSPKVGAEWIYETGDRNTGKEGGTYGRWHPMYRGYYPLLIRPFQGYYYFTSRFTGGQDLGLTNQHEFILSGSMKPLDDITIEAKAAKYYFDNEPLENAIGGRDVGTEMDFLTTYDYTEDVTFSFLSAFFFPGGVYDKQEIPQGELTGTDIEPQVASEFIGSCKVSF